MFRPHSFVRYARSLHLVEFCIGAADAASLRFVNKWDKSGRGNRTVPPGLPLIQRKRLWSGH